MDEMTKDLSAYRFEKALKNIDIAENLLNDECFNFSLNRSYYAAFDAMRAVNALDGFDSSKHSGVISHFNQLYVKNGVFPPETSSVIRRASNLRERSDYEDFYEATEDEAAETLEFVKGFIDNVKEYLTKNGII